MTTHALILSAAVSLIGLGAVADERRAPDSDRPTYDAPATRDDRTAKEAAKDAVADARAADRKSTEENRPFSTIGIGFEAGAGVGGFMDNRIASVTTAQGTWKARAIVGTRRHFAGEAAYVGGTQIVNALGIQSNATLMNHGFEGSFRWNVLTGMIQPYATGGVGYSHYTLGDARLTTSDVQSTGDVLTFPVSFGLAWKPNAFMLDARLSFHPSTNSAMIRDTNLSTWDVGAHAGFEF